MEGDEQELRRWQLMSTLSARLAEQGGDRAGYARIAAEIIGAELRDGALVVLLGPNAEPIIEIWHPDPSRVDLVRNMLAAIAPDLAQWIDDYAGAESPVLRHTPRADQPDYLAMLREYATVYLEDDVVAPVRDRSGRVRGLVVVGRDKGSGPLSEVDLRALGSAADTLSLVLELDLARTAQAGANRRWELAFDSAATGRAILTADGLFMRVNAAGCETLGRSAEELTGMKWDELVDDETALIARGVRDALDASRLPPSGTVVRIRRPDGTARWVLVIVTLVRTIDGQRDVWDLQFPDVTEQHEAEARAEMLQSLAESSPDFIAIADLDGAVKYINAAGRELVGMPPDREPATTTMRDFYPSDARPLDRPIAEWPQAREPVWQGVSSLRDWRGGDPIPVSVRTFTMRDHRTGEPVAIATVQRDIRRSLAAQSEIEQLAEQRRRLLAELLTAEQDERERIAQDVHDDAIQLLAAAQLRLQLLSNALGEQAPQRGMAEAVADLLSSAQASLRHLLRDLEPANQQGRLIEQVLSDAADAFFVGTNTAVRVAGRLSDVPPEVASVFCRAGREAVSNARRHAAASQVDISLSEDAGTWRLSVVDDGVGIGDELPARAGHRGLRGMRSRVEAVGGTCRIGRGTNGGTEVLLEIPRTAVPVR